MAVDQTPGVIETPKRDEVRDRYTEDYKLRVPDADVGPGTQPYVDGSIVADVVAPIYGDAVTIGRGTNLRTSAGTWLAEQGDAIGVYPRPAVGAGGFVSIVAAAGGTNILSGTQLKTKTSGLRYQVTATALYQNGDSVPVQGIDTGPSTNQIAGVVLEFTSPPPGCGPDATVVAQSDGSGLIGGRNADDDRALRALISDARANPPASGNDAQYQATIRATPGISIQQVFTYPAIYGPGTMGYVFTLNPSQPGAGRVPNAAQIAATEAWVKGQMPGDDSVFACDLTESAIRICIRVTWAPGASTWVDASPWPPYVTNDPVRVATLPPPVLTSFRLFTGTAITDPQAGQTIGFWDTTSGAFKRIRIGTVTIVSAGLIWDITPDRSYGASDPSFIPNAQDPASPWSESLNLVGPDVIAYIDTLGPGEQVASLPDPGLRRRRQPQSPTKWPSTLYSLGLANKITTSALEDFTILEPAVPYQTQVGTPASESFLISIGSLALYP